MLLQPFPYNYNYNVVHPSLNVTNLLTSEDILMLRFKKKRKNSFAYPIANPFHLSLYMNLQMKIKWMLNSVVSLSQLKIHSWDRFISHSIFYKVVQILQCTLKVQLCFQKKKKQVFIFLSQLFISTSNWNKIAIKKKITYVNQIRNDF